MGLCRRWIDEVEPYFVCLLGQRYGWGPPEEEIGPQDQAGYAGLSIAEVAISHASHQHSVLCLRRTGRLRMRPDRADMGDQRGDGAAAAARQGPDWGP